MIKHNRWIGNHDGKTSNQYVDGYSSFNERCKADTQDLDDLIHWLEYANTGYPAARQSVEQEEHWAELLRDLQCEKLVKELEFNAYYYKCKCSVCDNTVSGRISTKQRQIHGVLE